MRSNRIESAIFVLYGRVTVLSSDRNLGNIKYGTRSFLVFFLNRAGSIKADFSDHE